MYLSTDNQKYARSHEEATDEDLQKLKFNGTTGAIKKEESPIEDNLAGMTINEDPFKDVPVLSTTPAELYLFDTETDTFVIQEKEVNVQLASNGEFDGEAFESRLD